MSFIILFISSCGIKEKNLKPLTIRDIKHYNQNPSFYIKNIKELDSQFQINSDKNFNKKYFKPWDLKNISYTLEEATWGNMYVNKKVYGDNNLLISKKWFNNQIENSSYQKFNTLKQKAITVKNSNVRVFPTISKIFYNPENAGEGFPFDYNQNSAIKINSPLFISHLSKDKAWAFAQTNTTIGWISISDIAYVDDDLIKKFKNENYFIAIKDNFPIYNNNNFIDYIKLGTLFPVKNNNFIVINKNNNQKSFLSYIKISKDYIEKKPLKFNKKNLSNISKEFINEQYGWGGLLNHRDCSAFTKDFFAPFGFFLERNSSKQIEIGKYISIKDYSNEKKKKFIIQNATPFLTLIYLKGHIMLYIGEQDGEPLVFHNFWGIKTALENGDFGRFVVGKTAITTLEAGKELKNYVKEKSLITRIEGIVLIEKTH